MFQRMTFFLAVVGFSVLLSPSCDPDMGDADCMPGLTRACPDGAPGIQFCDEHNSWSACYCCEAIDGSDDVTEAGEDAPDDMGSDPSEAGEDTADE